MWQLARAWTSVPSLRIVAAPLLSTFFVSRIPYCAIISFFRSAIGCAAGLAIACSGHGSLGGSLGLAESGAELPAGLAKSGAPSVFGSLLIAPALAHTPAKPRKSLLIPGSAWSHDVFFSHSFCIPSCTCNTYTEAYANVRDRAGRRSSLLSKSPRSLGTRSRSLSARCRLRFHRMRATQLTWWRRQALQST
jgi:hypothetical protein